MKQHYIDEKTGITYTLQGNYYLPNFTLPAEEETKSIGVWGQRHLRYLKEHRKASYYRLANKRQTEQLSRNHRPAGGGNILQVGKTVRRGRRCNGNTQGIRPYGMSRTNEQHP